MELRPHYASPSGDFVLYNDDMFDVVPQLCRKFDVVFADPPYFLSNGGFSVQSGKRVSVDKGDWDRSHGAEHDAEFNRAWLGVCREHMTDAGTIWTCGTFHNIFSVATAMTELGFRILNAVTWQKSNPPPNLSCRMFTHSTEVLIWARRSKTVPHYYNYDLMHRIAGNRQMTDVWTMPAIAPWEKTCGKHPTQKPLALVVRALLASTRKGDMVLDPFAGSSTTGIAANIAGRCFVGVEKEKVFCEMSVARRRLLGVCKEEWKRKIPDLRESACV